MSEATPGPEAAQASEARTGSRGRRGPLGCLVEIVQTVVLTLVIFFGIQAFVAQPFRVEQYSMERTFEPGDYVLIDKLTPRWDSYSRGDIVVFSPPDGSSIRKEPFIKRVIGEPGDTVAVGDDGRVSVNGAVLDEPYLYRDEDGNPEPTLPGEEDEWLVPAGTLFVMGDHRMDSADSRSFGPIEISTIIGRGVIRYWPLSSFSLVTSPVYAGVPAP